ncbi:hypothetical protein NDN08_003362 [Rhodosorus marinus]|uniref:Pentacotripeptide-repeat region of PRORP domain-containing protein n=1 Tax=Rhodosorus marinus TaxID=101924 RepID=A0AAV8V0E2_9RHOD|nr:hypothetical protein NDN08_003362 [Rhodosorus marinus]
MIPFGGRWYGTLIEGKPAVANKIYPELAPPSLGGLPGKKLDRLLARCGVDVIWPLFEEKISSEDITAKHCLKMLRVSRPHMAEKLIKELEARGACDLYAYNLFLRQLSKGDAPVGPGETETPADAGNLKLLLTYASEMKQKGLSPDSITYGILIDHLHRIGRKKQAKMVVRKMFKRTECIHAETYLMLARRSFESGRDGRMEKLIAAMLAVGVGEKRLEEAFELLAESRLRRGLTAEAAMAMKRLRTLNDGKVTNRMTEMMIKHYLDAGQVGEALGVYHRAQICGTEPEEGVYAMLLPVVEKHGNKLLHWEIESSYRWNVLEEGVFEEQERQAKKKARLIRDLKYTGPKSLYRQIRYVEPVEADDDFEDTLENDASEPAGSIEA